MQQKPQRPFVPHRTPKSSTGIAASSEFRLSRPFVPDGEQAQTAVGISAGAAEPTLMESIREPALRGIEEFVQEDEYELPPIEHFTDPLPGVEAFAPGNEAAMMEGTGDAMDYTSVGTSPPVPGSAGWVEEDWQKFDWRAAAALGDAPDAEATNDWATTDWDAAARPRERRASAAQAIANALDNIARRIRDGDLAPAGPGELGDPAAIAAKVAALLGVRR